mmetsp:Transcript_3926/g.5996  ORF Transcript_3926/g.5996 Transcript_3926/m.5996 type:complete len:346 (+) Transcript_3926:285-1322(+)
MLSIITTTAILPVATATATAKATLVTTTRNKPAAPARFGKSMPYHLLSRPFTTTSSSSRSSSSSSSSSTTKDIPSTITRINTYNNKKEDSIQGQQSILVSKAGENRDESCPLCKKYSQGPCGKLFQQWIECIDANAKANANEGNGDGNGDGDGNGNGDESKTDCVCDSLVAPLDKCLKEHQEYYDKISIYDDDNDNDQQAIDKWKDFILAIEQDDGIQFEPCSQSQHPPEMEMQLRPKSNMGAAMFHPEMRNGHGHGDQGQGQGRVLLLAYIKDQNGALLGAGSVEDLFPFQDQYVLRFGVTDTCKDITAHALYGYKDGANADADADGSHESLTIYTKTQRVPPS